MNLWDRVLQRIEGKLNRHSFATWFRPTQFLLQHGETLVVRVPSPQFKDWLDKNYRGVIDEALAELEAGSLQVVFECEPLEPSASVGAGSPPAREGLSTTPLNLKYTFDSFVVGASNQFAHAAARAVAEIPSKSYNPLFLYGGVGLGKTHLMHAIGHYVLARHAAHAS